MSEVDTQRIQDDLAFVADAVRRRRKLGALDVMLKTIGSLLRMKRRERTATTS